MPHEIDFLEAYDLQSLAAELRRIAESLGKRTITMAEIDSCGRVTAATIIHKFGSMRSALLAAGLIPTRGRKWTNGELVKLLADLWTLTLKDRGRRPRMSDFSKYKIPVTAWTISSRFGTWKKALILASQVPDSGVMPEFPTSERMRVPISVRTRFRVFQRDLFQCRICRKSGVEFEVDHIVPVALGGTNGMENLQTLCVACNRGKRDDMQ